MKQNKVKIKYIPQEDILEVILKKNKIPEVLKLSSGVMLEFNKKRLTAIVLPNFLQAIHHPKDPNVKIEFDKMKLNEEENRLILTLKIYERIVNIKIDLDEIEKYK